MDLNSLIDQQLGFAKNNEVKLFYGTYKLRTLYLFDLINFIVVVALFIIGFVISLIKTRNLGTLIISCICILYLIVPIGFNIGLIAKKELFEDKDTNKRTKTYHTLVIMSICLYSFLWIVSVSYAIYYLASKPAVAV